jgi:transcriptional regulator with XRE-family HTH domain
MKGADTEFDMGWRPEIPPPALPQPLGAGYLILVARELSGLSQRALASEIGSSQPSLATLETGNRLPTIRTLLRIAEAAGLELVLGLRRPALPKPDPDTLDELGFALLGTLHPNAEDGLADFVVFREPKPWEGAG